MPLEIAINGEYVADAASKAGWDRFCQIVDEQSDDESPLRHLCEHGWYEPAADLAVELSDLSGLVLDEQMQDIIDNLEAVLKSRESDATVVVSDGTQD